MKLLIDKTDIAAALNFNKYPVFTLDLDSTVKGFEDCKGFKKGSCCRLRYDSKYSSEPFYVKCTLTLENCELTLSPETCLLKGSYNWQDHLNDAVKAMTPIVMPGQEVAILFFSSANSTAFVRIMRVSEKIDINCVTAATLTDVD